MKNKKQSKKVTETKKERELTREQKAFNKKFGDKDIIWVSSVDSRTVYEPIRFKEWKADDRFVCTKERCWSISEKLGHWEVIKPKKEPTKTKAQLKQEIIALKQNIVSVNTSHDQLSDRLDKANEKITKLKKENSKVTKNEVPGFCTYKDMEVSRIHERLHAVSDYLGLDFKNALVADYNIALDELHNYNRTSDIENLINLRNTGTDPLLEDSYKEKYVQLLEKYNIFLEFNYTEIMKIYKGEEDV
jgi:hypothetical protein